ncbi:thermonuclease family protein [Sphingomonas sp.]|jgi:endonuclease YncB( thermonuclease family)|uniref:thermonuclease family protein n=1 Tax=Sphingomonas sp. TaxID=28214 RepID=UPI00260C52AA|nr:thermonuclease family protein [Sphingomonas sp.]MDF2494043.1 nuclease [Sphingomonas sp.]
MRHDRSFHRTARRQATPISFWPAQRRRRKKLPFVAALLVAIATGLASGVWLVPDATMPGAATSTSSAGAAVRHFSLCHTGGGENCVVDGDTIWIGGEKVRLADIDTPETHPPRCAEEAALGEQATHRLQELLNAGPVTLADADRATDRYGRRLAIVTRNGQSLGDALVEEGLARPWEGRRRPWCN